MPNVTQFIEHRGIEWQRVRRVRYFCYQRFHYAYPGPIRDLRQNLVVVPVTRYGDQLLRDHQLIVSPYVTTPLPVTDSWGNQVFKLEVPHIEQSITFEVLTTIERTVGPRVAMPVTREQAEHYLRPTRLTASDERIEEVARDLAATASSLVDLAERISDWVANALHYGAGATHVGTTAAQALAIGKGLCQDYAHIMIAICRVAGLPARYVSGHMLGEGGSHAWVEVILPDSNGVLEAVAFDPTNRRRPNLGYMIVAIGRDYRDVSPTSGSFNAPYGGRLSFTKQAGLTLLEWTDGQVVGEE